jgi:N-acetylneuraminate synthase
MNLKPYIIAEIGVNHGGNLQVAKEMIRSAAEAGSDAVKFQLYKAEKIASFHYSKRYWSKEEEPTESQYELFCKYDAFGESEYRELSAYATALHLDFISTPFDADMVKIAAKISRYIKIASADITNLPLLRDSAKTGKPIILATGASTLAEIDNACRTIAQCGGILFAVMHCVLNYPLDYRNVNMEFMGVLRDRYGDHARIGYSDHTKPRGERLIALEFALVNGAEILEKHFTIDTSLPGNDHYHSMTGDMLKCFRQSLDIYEAMVGTPEFREKNSTVEETAIQHARRRIFAARDIESGELITEENLIPLRSSVGEDVLLWDQFIGKRATCSIAANQYILKEYLY